MPVHGLYRPNYVDPTVRTKRYIMSMPDVIEGNDMDNTEENEDKRSVGKPDYLLHSCGFSLPRFGIG